MRDRQSAIGNRQSALPPDAPAARRAFSLVEVLLAIVILGIGVISIAALFPAGIAQQRLSSDDLMGPVVASHAISMIRSKVTQDDFGSFEDFWDAEWGVAYPPGGYFTRTIAGDWGWMRPGFLLDEDTASGYQKFSERGAIDIFSRRRVDQVLGVSGAGAIRTATEHWDGWPNLPAVSAPQRALRGIPFNRDIHEEWQEIGGIRVPIPPRIIISQRERYYPMVNQLVQAVQDPPQPQYVWDCMFRRYQGRVYVAVFVYRVSAPGAAAAQPFVVQPRPGGGTNWQIPPVPVAIDLTNTDPVWPNSPVDVWDVIYNDEQAKGGTVLIADRPLPKVYGFAPGEFDPHAENQSWQSPRQWILDQNNHVHRVAATSRPTADEPNRMVIEFTRPLTPVRLPFYGGATDVEKFNSANDTSVPANTSNSPPTPNYLPPFNLVHYPSDTVDEYFANPEVGVTGAGPIHPDLSFPFLDRGVVTRFWYIPLRMEIDAPGGGEFVLTPVYIAVKEL